MSGGSDEQHQEGEEGLTLSGPTGFYGDGEELLNRGLDLVGGVESVSNSSEELLRVRFEVVRVSSEIKRAIGVKKVALQFPDHLLCISDSLAQLLQLECPDHEFFILADTSYGSCCIDEVAASHASADLLVHIGHCCLSLIHQFPISYSYDCQPIEVDDCIEALTPLLQNEATDAPNPKRRFLLLSELSYSHKLGQIQKALITKLPTSKFEFIMGYVPHTQNIPLEPDTPEGELPLVGADITTLEFLRESGELRRLCGRYFPASLLDPQSEVDPEWTTDIIYIGTETIELTNLLMTKDPNRKVYRYDPASNKAFEDGQTVNRRLMRRYHLVQKARDASTFGIVVGTLGVGNYLEMIQHVKDRIESSGGKVYTFVMGKLNVAKLANFLEIEIFVLVACPENSLIDSKEFLRPVVTPYEIELALNPVTQWTGRFVTDFVEVLKEGGTTATDAEGGSDEEADDVPHFSLVTGKFVNPRQYQKMDPATDSSHKVLLRDQPHEISQALGSSAGEFLATRSFQGLDPQRDATPVSLATPGRQGIARGYVNEKEL